MSKGIMRAILGGIAVLSFCGVVGAGTSMAAEPSLLVYPNEPAVFRYDPARYEIVHPSDPNFDTVFSVAGEMLWDKVEGRIPEEVYRAPALIGFEVSPFGTNEFVLMTNEFTVIVDGYNEFPRTFSNLYMRFIPEPSHSSVLLLIDGEEVYSLNVPIDPLVVTTPVGDDHYADTRSHELWWTGATGLRITVYSDKNNDLAYNDGEPRFSIYAKDATISTEETSWGRIKAEFR
jgi:hypothetical protein